MRTSGVIAFDSLTEIPPFSHSYWMLGVIIPIAPLLLDLHGFYTNPITQRYESAFVNIANAGFWLMLLLSIASIFGKLEVPSRSVLILFLITSPILLLCRFWATRQYLIRAYKHGKFDEQSVVIGTASDISAFMRGLASEEKMELQISRWFDIDQLDSLTIRKNVRSHAADRVIFVSPDSPKNEDLPFEFETEGLEIWVVTHNITNGLLGTPIIQSTCKNRVLVFKHSVGDFWHRFLKRTVDIIGSLAGILLFLPLAVVISVAIKFTSPGPIVFRQVRSGRRGRRFTILKFRSMVANAPDLHADLADKNEMKGPAFKLSQDPRVTPLGAFLRRTSLDELPQFINVLRGEMSLVGPRPLPDYETMQIEKSVHRRRLSVKPGLTCLWQIRGRNSIISFEDWVQLDIEYIENASLALDLWIILQTIPAVLFRKGAR
jgi:exopolysaccharide biosynthesis polyprenyl glycosylphosphotransferase